ncbi:hypothetical protein JKG47_01035 [Acidithiobacillus sp. MC6.1]|nr:hypothetical protein [Acidithiobacillus sp. MC6.1]
MPQALDIKEIPNAITGAGSVQRLVENLFYGWGYNAYRKENQLRADDLLIRSRLSDLLGQCREVLRAREMDWRREHLPPPSREHPYPDHDAVRAAQNMEYFGKQIGQIETLIRAAPAPENDRVWQRHRTEADTLAHLAQADREMAENVIALLQCCRSAPVSDFSLDQIRDALDKRNAILRVFG